MAQLRYFAPSLLLLAALQSGCAALPGRSEVARSSLAPIHPTCDTSVKFIDLDARLRNTTGGEIDFNLVGDRGPPYDLYYMGYRVYASDPGEPYELVHDSGHDSQWTRKVAIAPGNAADFNVPLFGLRPGDYRRYFRIEMRDSKNRSYWTPAFELCAVYRPNCGCPRVGVSVVGTRAVAQACPAAPAGDRCE